MQNSYLSLSDGSVLPKNQIHFKYFFIVLALFISTWLTSDIAAVKMVSVFGITLTGGFIIFPFTTMLGSVLVEVYGYKNARQAIWAGLALNLTFVFFINIVYLVPASPHWKLNSEFKSILVPGMRIAIASSVSFIISEFANSYLMAKMKISSKGKSLIKRIFVSCSCSFLLDIILFLTLAFYGTMPDEMLFTLICIAYIKKVLCQIIFFPLVCYIASLLKKYEGIDLYDYNTKFNPFSLDNVYELDRSGKDSSKKNSSILEDRELNHAAT